MVTLDDQQQAAVDHDEGPALVSAGPGSGKTRVITHRAARLLKVGCPGREMFVCTFTKSATEELSKRLKVMVGTLANDVWIGTFHGLCARILRSCDWEGRTREFAIIDEDEAAAMFKNIYRKVVVERYGEKKLKEYERTTPPDRMKEEIDQYLEACNLIGDMDDESDAREMVTRYQARMCRCNVRDFSDLLVSACSLVKQTPIWRHRFKQVMVDEFQDTNIVQFEFARAITGSRSLFVCGDVDQSLYAWRGASPENMLDFSFHYADARTYLIERNYRSTGRIVAACQAVIEVNTKRITKTMRAVGAEGRLTPVDVCGNQEEEAEYVIGQVATSLAGGRLANEHAVLYRTKRQSRALEMGLVRRAIRYRIVGGHRFFDRAEIKAAIAWMKAVDHPDNDGAFVRALGIPKRGIGDTTVALLEARAAARSCSVHDAVVAGLESGDAELSTKDGRLRQFVSHLRQAHDRLDELPLREWADWFLHETGLYAHFARVDEVEAAKKEKKMEKQSTAAKLADEAARKVDGTRVDNLRELVVAVAAFVGREQLAGREPTLSGYLEEVDLTNEFNRETKTEDLVSLMTVHGSKGREYDHVWVVGMNDGRMPLIRAGHPTDYEEERRIAYVAMSRARSELNISYVWADPMGRPAVPSRYLFDIPVELLDWPRRPIQASCGMSPPVVGSDPCPRSPTCANEVQ